MTSAQTDNEVVYVRVTEVPLKTLLEKISYEIGAEWARDGGGFRLVRTASKQQLLDNEDAIKIERKLRESAKKSITACNFDQPYTVEGLEKLEAAAVQIRRARRDSLSEEDRQRLDNLQLQMLATDPSQRLLWRVLSSIDFGTLARMDIGDRMVFATQPTVMQRGLPSQTMQNLKLFDSEFITLQTKARKGRRAPLSDEELRAIQNRTYSRAYLVANRMSINAYNFSLMATDPASRIIANAGFQLSFSISDLNQNVMEPMVSGGPLDVNPVARELGEIMYGPSVLKVKQVSEGVRAILDDPDTNEPLEVLVGSYLSELIPTDSNVVVSISDSASQLLFDTLRAEPTPSKEFLFKKLQTDGGITLARADGWVTGRPSLWKQYSASRVNRPALKLLIEAFKQGYPTLDQLGNYSTITPIGAQMDLSFARWHGGSLGIGLVLQTRNEARFAYQVLHTIGGVRTLRQWNGRPIPVAQVAVSKPTLADWVFNSHAGPQRLQAGGDRNDRSARSASFTLQVAVAQSSSIRFGDVRESNGPNLFERTDYLLNGVGEQSQLIPRIGESDIVQMKNSKTGQVLVMSVESFATMKAGFDAGLYRKDSGMDDVTQFDLYRVLKQVNVNIALRLDPPSISNTGVVGYELVNDGSYGSFGSLPEAIRNRYESTYTKSMDSYIRSGARRGGDNGTRQP